MTWTSRGWMTKPTGRLIDICAGQKVPMPWNHHRPRSEPLLLKSCFLNVRIPENKPSLLGNGIMTAV